MLLKNKATKTRTMAPINVGVSIKLHVGADNIMINGFDPAGGCTVLVIIMAAIVVPAARAMLHQCALKSDKNTNPINEART
jgi:transcriptional regulator of nitric oxide reductase